MSAIGPFPDPAPGCTPAPAAALTPEQQTKYGDLLKDVTSWETIPTTSAKDAESEPLSDSERMWLTRECLLRYLRATKWNLAQASQRLRTTLIWRREYGAEKLTAEYISEENATGKQLIMGFDKEGRPCQYLLPQYQNTKETPKRVEHVVYMLERAIDIHPPGQESLTLLIDFRNTSAGGQTSFGIAKQVLDILQNHYPERLGRALLTHLPWYVNIFLKAIMPFVDPVTKTKIKQNEPLPDHVPTSQLLKSAGGDVDFKYEHDVYWPALEKLAAERVQQRKERWEKAGKTIGESEIYLFGGSEGSVNVAQEAVPEKIETTETPAIATTDAPVAVKENGEASKDDAALAGAVEKLDVEDSKESADANQKTVPVAA